MVQVHGYFDGACEPRNPGGNMGIGACLHVEKEEIFKHSAFVKAGPQNSNNVAEYMGFEALLDFIMQEKYLQRIAGTTVKIFGDSKLVINQMFARWQMKGGMYVPYAKRCKEKLATLRDMGFTVYGIWIPREQNKYADQLSKAELVKHNVKFKIQPLK